MKDEPPIWQTIVAEFFHKLLIRTPTAIFEAVLISGKVWRQ